MGNRRQPQLMRYWTLFSAAVLVSAIASPASASASRKTSVVNPGDAWCSVVNAAAPGDTIVFGAGSYPDTCSISASGTAVNPITLRSQSSAPADRAVLAYSGTSSNIIDVYGSYLVFRWLTFGPTAAGAGVNPIKLRSSVAGVVIDENVFQGTDIAVAANSSGSTYQNISVTNNVLKNLQSTGLYFGCHDGTSCHALNILIRGNLIQNVLPGDGVGYGLEIKLNSYATITENTVYASQGPGIEVYGSNRGDPPSVVERNYVEGAERRRHQRGRGPGDRAQQHRRGQRVQRHLGPGLRRARPPAERLDRRKHGARQSDRRHQGEQLAGGRGQRAGVQRHRAARRHAGAEAARSGGRYAARKHDLQPGGELFRPAGRGPLRSLAGCGRASHRGGGERNRALAGRQRFPVRAEGKRGRHGGDAENVAGKRAAARRRQRPASVRHVQLCGELLHPDALPGGRYAQSRGPLGRPGLERELGQDLRLHGAVRDPADRSLRGGQRRRHAADGRPGLPDVVSRRHGLPSAATINYSSGQTRANNAVVSLGGAGDIAIRCQQGSGTAHVVVDVVGYFQ